MLNLNKVEKSNHKTPSSDYNGPSPPWGRCREAAEGVKKSTKTHNVAAGKQKL